MKTVRDDAIWYLRNAYGAFYVDKFQEFTGDGQRDGQAFMNLLNQQDYSRLTGSLIDPFYRDGNIPAAVDLLTTKEK